MSKVSACLRAFRIFELHIADDWGYILLDSEEGYSMQWNGTLRVVFYQGFCRVISVMPSKLISYDLSALDYCTASSQANAVKSISISVVRYYSCAYALFYTRPVCPSHLSFSMSHHANPRWPIQRTMNYSACNLWQPLCRLVSINRYS